MKDMMHLQLSLIAVLSNRIFVKGKMMHDRMQMPGLAFWNDITCGAVPAGVC